MGNMTTAKSSVKSNWLALLLGVSFAAVTAQSCSIDTSKYTFIPDDEFADASAVGGNANGGGPHAGANNGGGMNSGGDAGMSGGASGAGGSGGGECTPGEHACSPDGHLQTCTAGEPAAFDTGVACGEGKCSASLAACLKCVPGDFQCANNVLQQCNIFGSSYEDAAICDSKAACSASGQKGFCVHCKPGTSSCEASLVHVLASTEEKAEYLSTDLVTCNLDGSGTDTTQICVAENPLCDPLAKKCSSCAPGTYSCDGNSLNSCNSDGSGYTFKQSCQAPNGACNAATGKCEPPACNNGTYLCQSNVLQVCNNGKYSQLDVCETRDLCDANSGRCQKCSPSSNSCVGDTLQSCDYNFGEALPYTSTTCYPGTCVSSGGSASCSCREGTSMCYDGSTSYTACGVNGVNTFVQCPKDSITGAQQVCNSKYGKCGACVPGRFQCDGAGVLKQCLDDASDWRVVSDCTTAGKQCDAGRGACIGAPPGRFFCDDKGDLYSVGYDDNGTHKIVNKLVDHCGSPNQCAAYDGVCRAKRCVAGQSTCSGADVYSCDTGDHRTRTSTRCSSVTRCQDGFGCVKALAIAAGDAHTCVVVAGSDALEGDPGYVMCWGANESGQLGDGSPLFADSKEARPVLIGPGPGDGGTSTTPRLNNYFSAVSAGKNFTCAELKFSDDNGGSHSAAACWGSNAKGQLGAAYADPGAHNGPFSLVTDKPGTDKGIDLHGVTCGSEFACALGSDGTPWCWGANESGQLGNGSNDSANAATPIIGTSFAQLSAGARHVCGIKSNGTVWCWGDGSQGQLGNGSQKGSSVPILVGKVAASPDRPMALGNDFSLVLGAKGSKNPSAWGANTFGQLGNASTTNSGAPSDLLGLLSADLLGGALFSGSSAEHACARLGDRLFCWGANVFGEVGDGTTIDRASPVQIFDAKTELSKLGGSTHAVALGGRHTCAITARGDVLCWGANHRQQLGNNAVTPQRVPLRSF